MGYYRELRAFIKALEEHGKLLKIERKMDKDSEVMPLVSWQFRGLAEEQRKAFLFENVVDAKGKRFDGSMLVASHGASSEIYALGMMCKLEEMMYTWEQAQSQPIRPVLVGSGICQEEVHVGGNLLEHGGLLEFPTPISTPGFDGAPYFTAANWVTKDPETGIRNVGNYRAMVKSATRTGINAVPPQHIFQHWDKCRRRGIPLQAAIVVGVTPSIGYVSITKIPYGVDEYDIAGGIAGEPVELVKCRTVDIEVPATAEIVIEGELPTDSVEREGPFGEHTGYIHSYGLRPYFNVTCITHRRNPVYNVFISAFPPSESSKIRQISDNAVLFHFLKDTYGIRGIQGVCWHEESGSRQFVVISLKKNAPSDAWQALKATDTLDPSAGKIIIAVDEDIDARDLDSVVWALCYRMQPHRDILVSMGKTARIDPSAAPPGTPAPPGYERGANLPTSSILIDATRKWDYPPIALPAREFMEKAKAIWEELQLPSLKPKFPWHGVSLGNWTSKLEEEAALAVKGEYLHTGEKLAKDERSGS
jgi:UbiD family decarboxylase